MPFIRICIILLVMSTFNTHAEDSTPKIKSSLVLGLSHVRSLFTPSMVILNSTNFDFLDIIEPVTAYADGYLLSLNLGTPAQVFQVYLDTGSDLSWVPCGTSSYQCLQCGNEHSSSKPTPTFFPSQSSTNTRDLCGSRFCVDVHSSDNRYDPCAAAGCSVTAFTSGLCPRACPPFSYTYGGGALILGFLSRDAVTLHGSFSGSGNGGPLPIQFPGFCFGCVGSSIREPIGIAGFGKGALSLPSQLGFLDKAFSHCFLGFRYARNPNVTSPLVLGDLAVSSVTSDFLFTPMLKSVTYPNFYYIGLEGLSLGDGAAAATTAAPPSLAGIDPQGNGGVIVDTGTTYTHLPDPFYASVTASIVSTVPYERSRDLETRTGFDLCFKVPCARAPCADDDALPTVSLHLAGGARFALPKQSCYYPVTAPKDSVVVKCLLFQRMEDGEDGAAGGPGAVLGSFQMQNVEVIYHLETSRIGFRPRDCSAAATIQA